MPRNSASDKRRSRSDKRGMAHLMAQAFPDDLRAKLAPHLDTLVTELVYDLKTRVLKVGDGEATNSAHRTALDTIPRIMKAIGADEDALMRAIVKLGFRDLTQVESAARMFRDAEGATGEDSERVAVQVIRARVKANPREAARLMEACFGTMAVRVAAPQLTNGHSNGHTNGGPHA